MAVLDRRSGRSKWSLELTVFILFLRCWAHVRRLSNVKPRYFIIGVVGIRLLLSNTEGQSRGLKCEDQKISQPNHNSGTKHDQESKSKSE